MINETLLYNDDVTKAGASWHPHIIKQINRFIVKEELDTDIQSQYIHLTNLGINYMQGFDELPEQSLIDMIDYIDENYFSLPYKESINLSSQRLQTMGRFIYEILFVDMVKITLPSLETVPTDSYELKKLLVSHFNFKIKALETMHNVDETINMPKETMKLTVALDIFDTDLTDFVDSFIIPILDQYSDYIDLKNGI
jgi:hypothetical protein